MSNEGYEYDPGDFYHGPPPRSSRERRRRLRENQYDDAWAAAESEAYGEDIAPGDLAAGYVDEDYYRRRHGRDDHDEPTYTGSGAGLGPTPTSPRRPRPHQVLTRQERIRRRYDPRTLYPDSPSYQRHQGASFASTGSGSPAGGPLAQLPFWGILMLVILGVAALGAVVLACASVLLLI